MSFTPSSNNIVQSSLNAVLRRWWIVVTAALAFGLFSGMLTMQQTVPYSARASVVLIPTSFKAPFPQTYIEQEVLYQYQPITVNQYAVLLELARSDALEERVAAALQTNHHAGELLSRINITTNGDYLLITALAESSEEAEHLASAWAKEYVQLVLETFSQYQISQKLIEQQLQLARQQYQSAQDSLESFLAKGEMVIVEQQLAQLQNSLDSAPMEEHQRLNEQLIAVRAQYEQLSSQYRELVRERDIAFEHVANLLQKSYQLRLADTTPPVLARHLSTVAYATPSVNRTTAAQVTIAVLIGAILSIVTITLREAVARLRRNEA